MDNALFIDKLNKAKPISIVVINKFWKRWRNITPIERKAITSTEKAIEFLIDNISKDNLISIYIKGSFVTRELKRKSDIDILPIVNDRREMKRLGLLRDKNKEILKPAELLPIAYTELRQKNRLWGRADTFLRDLEHHEWIYGKKLSKLDYPLRSWDKMFADEVKMLKNKSLPLHKKGEFGFQQLIKQVFWLSYSEQVLFGKSPPRTWKGLNKFIKDKTHIIHKAYYFRIHPTKDKRKRKAFVIALEKYLEKL